jgi:hypothetical protein
VANGARNSWPFRILVEGGARGNIAATHGAGAWRAGIRAHQIEQLSPWRWQGDLKRAKQKPI